MAEVPRVDLGMHGDDVLVISPVGDFDVDSVDRLRSVFADAITATQNRVVIDLSGTTFLDSMCLGTIIGAAKRATGGGGWLRLVSPTKYVAKVLKVTGLDSAFGTYATVAEAVSLEDDGLSAPA